MSELADPHAPTLLTTLDAGAEPEEGSPVLGRRYEILALIGNGGMGTVYRARDRELDEIVALKVLKRELADAPGVLSRFRREVKLARRVTHRNVARTFDIGEADGTRFLTMELVSGTSLASHLARVGRVPSPEVADIVTDLCAGLDAAHSAGVLHRDLKPDNVILADDRRAVITDFGIARAAIASHGETAAGTFIGTPLYMAPEQVEGLEELDARADLYALGVVMYEMLTGRAAWARESLLACAAARLLGPPPDPRGVVPDLPAEIADLVLRLMARRREDRPASAADVKAELASLTSASSRRIPAAAPVAVRKRIAVLPIKNLGPEADAYLAYGISQDLVDLLGTVEGLAVRSSAGATATDGRSAGRSLDVDAVVEGSLRRDGGRVVANLRVVSVEDGFQLWGRRFDKPEAEILTIATEAAEAIAAVLTTRFDVPSHATQLDAAAQELFLKGRYALNRGLGGLFQTEALELLREAHALDAGSARIAGTYAMAIVRSYRGGSVPESAVAEARAVALRALELDATRPEARIALGALELAAGHGPKAAKELAGALRVAHTSPDALDAMGNLLVEAGRPEEGMRLIELALAQEVRFASRLAIARTRALLGDWDGADAMMPPPAPNDPAAIGWSMLRSRLAIWSGDPRRVVRLADELRAVQVGGAPQALLQMIAEVAASGLPAEGVRAVFARLEQVLPGSTPRGRCFRAQLRAEGMMVAGDVAAALAAIRAANDDGLFDVVWLDRCPPFEPLRGEASFAEVRASVAARAEAIAAAYDRARIVGLLRGRR